SQEGSHGRTPMCRGWMYSENSGVLWWFVPPPAGPRGRTTAARTTGGLLRLRLDPDEGDAGGGQGLEALELVLVPGGGQLAVEDRVQRGLLGHGVDDLAPGCLRRGLVIGLGGLVELGLDHLVGRGLVPAEAVLGPHVAAVEPAQQQVQVI